MRTERQYIPKEFVIGSPKVGYVRRRAEPSSDNRLENIHSSQLSLYAGDEENLTSEDRFLARLLGRPLTYFDRMDYYWEEQPEPVEKKTMESHYFADSNPMVKNAVSGVAWLGREAMSLRSVFQCSSPLRPACKRSHKPEDEGEKEMNTPVASRTVAGGLSDTMISVVAGVLISFFIVFPLLRKGGGAIYASIFKSTVRKISEDVSLNIDADASILLPFLNRGSHGSTDHYSREEGHSTRKE